MIKHYDLTESDVSAKPYEAEALYYCTDSKNIYFDSPTEGERIKMSSDTIIIGTEAEREKILAPIADKIYVVLDSGTLYIYSSTNGWINLGGNTFEISDVLVSGGTKTITDSRVRSTSSAEFVPDLSVADLVTSCSVACSNGSLTINISPSTYKIIGRLIVRGGAVSK